MSYCKTCDLASNLNITIEQGAIVGLPASPIPLNLRGQIDSILQH
jgi:hypothetical protein